MSVPAIDAAQRKAARVVGWAALIATASVVYSNFGIYEHLVVPRNAAETARNILAHETLFRVSVACNLVYGAGVLILLAALYTILKPVNRTLALIAACFRLMFAVLWVGTALNMLGALRLLGDTSYLQVFDADRLQLLARLELAANFDAYYVGLPFFALASTVCAWLWLKSGYIPRALAAAGVLASAWCVACAFAFIIFPDFEKTVGAWWFDSPMAAFEIVLSVWLLLKGLKPSPVVQHAQASVQVD